MQRFDRRVTGLYPDAHRYSPLGLSGKGSLGDTPVYSSPPVLKFQFLFRRSIARACRNTPLRVLGYLLASLSPLDGSCFCVLSMWLPFLLTWRPEPHPASICAD